VSSANGAGGRNGPGSDPADRLPAWTSSFSVRAAAPG
jgi:hypothetical protein